MVADLTETCFLTAAIIDENGKNQIMFAAAAEHGENISGANYVTKVIVTYKYLGHDS